ncbi:hypothetical protein LSAT2_005932 [Lamellibrachia satsuma]|nr:hypothetical protein LSAT2_005932 [Lamellibrachia satsuma]
MEYVGWFLMGFIPAGIGFRFGAPTNACSSMIPRHVHTVNVIPCPYKLKLQDDATTYTPGGNLKAPPLPRTTTFSLFTSHRTSFVLTTFRICLRIIGWRTCAGCGIGSLTAIPFTPSLQQVVGSFVAHSLSTFHKNFIGSSMSSLTVTVL